MSMYRASATEKWLWSTATQVSRTRAGYHEDIRVGGRFGTFMPFRISLMKRTRASFTAICFVCTSKSTTQAYDITLTSCICVRAKKPVGSDRIND